LVCECSALAILDPVSPAERDASGRRVAGAVDLLEREENCKLSVIIYTSRRYLKAMDEYFLVSSNEVYE
jgi:hypothetical protein